jgi:hypothetical protein
MFQYSQIFVHIHINTSRRINEGIQQLCFLLISFCNFWRERETEECLFILCVRETQGWQRFDMIVKKSKKENKKLHLEVHLAQSTIWEPIQRHKCWHFQVNKTFVFSFENVCREMKFWNEWMICIYVYPQVGGVFGVESPSEMYCSQKLSWEWEKIERIQIVLYEWNKTL